MQPAPTVSAAVQVRAKSPRAPAKLGEPVSFQFVVPLHGRPNAIVPLDTGYWEAAPAWAVPGARIDTDGDSRGRGEIAALAADATKLPEALRLEGTAVHVFVEDEALCDATLGAVRVGTFGTNGVSPRMESIANNPWVLFYELELAADCAERYQHASLRVVWARDASLAEAVFAGHSTAATDPSAKKDVQRAAALARQLPSFRHGQWAMDVELRAAGRHSEPIEESSLARWTRYVWQGERRAYLSIGDGCNPHIAVGIDYRERPDGTLELIGERPVPVPSPLVLADVDADGELEAIESGLSRELVAFDRQATPYARIEVDACR
jgi:hypothetical protein